MARLVRVVHIDDVDGSEGASPVEFSIGSDAYTIDLTEDNEQALREALAPFIEKAEKITRRRGGANTRTAPKRSNNTAIREWARENGYDVSSRGRIAADIVEAYEAR